MLQYISFTFSSAAVGFCRLFSVGLSWHTNSQENDFSESCNRKSKPCYIMKWIQTHYEEIIALWPKHLLSIGYTSNGSLSCWELRTDYCAYFLGPSGSSTVTSSRFTSSSTVSNMSGPSIFISATSFSFLGAFSFFSFCLGGALRFGFGASLRRTET